MSNRNFEITTPEFDQLSPDEKLGASNNGSGKEYANYIRITRNGKTVYLESDAMEPEDARLTRDLRWVKEAINYAYQCGMVDGASH